MLDPQARALLDELAALGRPPIWDVPIEVARAVSTATNVRLAGPPQPVAEVRALCIPSPAGPIAARAYIPAGISPLPIVVYFHGGGFTVGSLDGYDATLRALANASGAIVVSVDYRLAPEHRFPAGLEDCYAATLWLARHAASLGADSKRLAVGGDSAGGNLAAVVALLARDCGEPKIAFQLLVYPTTDGDVARDSYLRYGEGHLLTTATCRWFTEQYISEADRDDWRHRPLLAPTLVGLPPAHVLVAECDPLYDEARAYADRLAASGVRTTFVSYSGMIHGFFNYSGVLERSRTALGEAGAALRAALGIAEVPVAADGSAKIVFSRTVTGEEHASMNDEKKSANEAMSTAAERIREMFKSTSLPHFDMEAYVEARRDDIDAISKATSVALGSAQTITAKQAELLKSSLEQLREALATRGPGEGLGEMAGKERELIAASLSRTLEGMREMAEAAQKSQVQVFDLAIDRIRSNAELLRGMFGTGPKK